MHYLKTTLIIILVILVLGAYFIFSILAWAEYITLFLLSIFVGIIFYGFFKNWSLKMYLWLLTPIFLQGIIFFNLIPSQNCKLPGSDTWSVKCECSGIEISEPIMGGSQCIGKVHSCMQWTGNEWVDYVGYI